MRSAQYIQGYRAASKAAVAQVHELAAQMNDPHAQRVLNAAALDLGIELKRHCPTDSAEEDPA